jgi:SAM-dependent methyltransferase
MWVAFLAWRAWYCCRKRRYQDWPNLHVRRGDISDPSLPAQLVHYDIDTALCINVLEHIEDDVEALGHIWQILRPGGRLLLLVPADSCGVGVGGNVGAGAPISSVAVGVKVGCSVGVGSGGASVAFAPQPAATKTSNRRIVMAMRFCMENLIGRQVELRLDGVG